MTGAGALLDTEADGVALAVRDAALLFTDIEGSTLLLQHLGPEYSAVLTRHNDLLRAAIAAAGGSEVSTAGDSFFAIFDTASAAVQAAIDAQTRLQAEPWPDGSAVWVRMGIHLGEVRRIADDYVGLDVHRAARICDAARGGQVLLSRAACEAIADYDLPGEARLRDLGRHRLKDLRYPELLHDLQMAGLKSVFDPLRSLGTRPTNITPLGTPLFGRDSDIAAVTRLLADPGRRVVTLYGPGGVGKSSLAIRVGEQALDSFPDGVHLVQLGGISDQKLVFPSIAQVLGVRDFAGRPVLMDIAAEIGAERRLLILDTFEHLVEAGAQITQLVEMCPHLHVLVTSRAALDLRVEATHPVMPLALPDPGAPPDSILQSPSAQLFVERVREVDPDFIVTPDNAPVIARICKRLEGIPLAIELGAARAKILSPEKLLERLNARLSVLKGGRRDGSLRHRTLRAAIEWSDNLLEPDDRDVFVRLAVFTGGFALDDAEEVLEGTLEPHVDVLDALESLVGKSLVTRGSENGEPRFGMFDMIREYAIDALEENGTADDIRARHMRYFAGQAERVGAHALTSRMRPHMLRLLSDAPNHRAALDWAIAQGDVETAARFIYALHWVWISQATFTEALAWVEKATAMLKGKPDSCGAALIQEAACSVRMASGDYVGGLPHGNAAKRIFAAIGDADGVARIELTRSICATAAGEIEDPSDILMASIGHFRGKDDGTAALGLILLGEGARMAGALDAAESCQTEALTIFEAQANVFWPGHIRQNCAHFRLREGRHTEAADLLAEAYDMADDYNFVMIVNLCVAGLSGVALQAGDPRLAAVIQGGSAAHLKKIGVEFEPTDRADIQTYVDGARAALGEAAYLTASAEGAAMDWDALRTLARSVADRLSAAA